MPQAQVVIWSLAFLATPGLILPVNYASANLRGDATPAAIGHALLVFRLFFITLTMTAIGLVALLIWDGIFPDRRDARILTPLPVPGSVLIGARLLALGALCGIFVVGINAVPTVFYAPMIAVFGGAANLAQGVLAYVVANGLAGVFVFSSLVALQGLVQNLGGKRASDRLSLLLQVCFVMALLQMIFFLPRMGAVLPADLNSGWVRLMPSVWFLGLYDVIGGRPAAGAPALALVAILATATTVGGSIVLFVATHARLTRRAFESREITAPGRNGRRNAAGLTTLICRRPVERAFTTAAWEARFLVSQRVVTIFIFVIGAVIAALMKRRHQRLSAVRGLRFHEEDHAAIFEGFHLSEGFAAATESARKLR